MRFLKPSEYISNFYKNKKNNPGKPFPLAAPVWEEKVLFPAVKRSIGFIFIVTFLYIAAPVLLGTNESLEAFILNVPYLLRLAIFIPIMVVIVTVPVLIITNPVFSYYAGKNMDYFKESVPENFVYSLRSWLNSRYGLNVSNQQVISLIRNSSTIIDEHNYKIIYSEDEKFITEMVMNDFYPNTHSNEDKNPRNLYK